MSVLVRDIVHEFAKDMRQLFGVDISPVVKNEKHFDYWADNLPYYRNVRDEGVVVNAG